MVRIKVRKNTRTGKTWVRLTHRLPIELAEANKMRLALAKKLFDGIEPPKELAMTTISILFELAPQSEVEKALDILLKNVDEKRLIAALRKCEFQVE